MGGWKWREDPDLEGQMAAIGAEFRVWSPVKILGENATVSELIDSDTKQWKRDLIFECFNNF